MTFPLIIIPFINSNNVHAKPESIVELHISNGKPLRRGVLDTTLCDIVYH